MENFTALDKRIFGSDLTAAEKVVWIAIKSFEINGQGCVTPIQGIAKRAGYGFRHAQRVIDRLVAKDYCLKIIHRGGPSCLTVKFPDTHDIQVMTQESRPNGHDPQVTGKPDLGGPMTSRSRPNGHTKTLRTNTEKKEEEQEPASPPPPDKRKPVIKDPEKLKEALSAINITELIREFEPQGIDAAAVYDRFCDRVIGDQNPQNYRDFKRALRRWLSYEVDKVKKRQAKPPPKEPEWMK